MMKHTSKALLSLILTASVIGASSPCLAEANAAAEAEPDYSKLYDAMIAKASSYLKASNTMVAAREAEIKRLQKGAESAKWRVSTAREKYDEALAGLATDPAKWQSKLEQQHSLLKQDAVKLGAIIARGREISAELTKQAAELKSLTDDAGIEADRFPETDYRRKRVLQLLAESEWTQNKAGELAELSNTDLGDPVAETFDQATVSNTARSTAAAFAAPAEFVPLAGVSSDQLGVGSGKAQFTRVGQIKRDGKSCDAWCAVDDPSGLRGKSGDLQLRCVGGAPAANEAGGSFVISHWDNGKLTFPTSSRIHELACNAR